MGKWQSFFERYKRIIEYFLLVAFDCIFLYGFFETAVFIRLKILPNLYPGFPPELPPHFEKAFWIFGIWLFFFIYEGLYTKRFSLWDEVIKLWKVAFFSIISVFVIVSLGKLSGYVSRTVLILMSLLFVCIYPPVRISLKRVLRRFGMLKRRVIIIGVNELGERLLKAFEREPNLGYEVIAFLDDNPESVGRRFANKKVHGYVDRADVYLKRCYIQDIFIALPGSSKERIQSLINKLQHKAKGGVFYVPELSGVAVLGTTLHHFFSAQLFALEIKNNLERKFNRFLKRSFDLLTGLILLIILAIPMLLIALLIKLESSGPVIFSQERVGRNGKKFKCYKFRTMYEEAHKLLESFLEGDEQMRKEFEEFYKLKNDPRVTRVGRFLRETSLDELPQLFNVLKGEMSLVGPRPVTEEEIKKYYKELAELCFSVPPGITGLWQVSGRSNTTYELRVALDAWYVRNWNLILDFIILLKTIKVVFKREGAY
ncbi:MAG: undecaprenyl-phosphate galactose phosphotransferase WbaP [Thermodesulfobacterium sp.]|nr:undecaprenyl-phosphate galactose phosphotransferase WbaP [Thermodesulfobacterium sp.]